MATRPNAKANRLRVFMLRLSKGKGVKSVPSKQPRSTDRKQEGPCRMWRTAGRRRPPRPLGGRLPPALSKCLLPGPLALGFGEYRLLRVLDHDLPLEGGACHCPHFLFLFVCQDGENFRAGVLAKFRELLVSAFSVL